MIRPVEQEVMLRIDLADGLGALSPRQRLAVLLLYQGCRQIEIAEIMGITPQSVNELLERASSRIVILIN